MKNFLIHWVTVAVSLWVATKVVPGVEVGSLAALAIAALVLGFVNAAVRPVLVILTLPITLITLGLFYLVVNAAAFGLAAFFVPGFAVSGLFSAMLGALVVGAVSWLIGLFTGKEDDND
jgi:putative membrane protein